MPTRRRSGRGSAGSSRQGAAAARRRAVYFPQATSVPRGDNRRGIVGNLAHIGQLSSPQGRRNTATRAASMHGPRVIPVVHQIRSYVTRGGSGAYTPKPVRGGHSRNPNPPRVDSYVMPWLRAQRTANAKFMTKKTGGSRYA